MTLPQPRPQWEIDQNLQAEARELESAQLFTFIEKITLAYPSSFFPAKLTQELVLNPKLSLESLISSKVSPALFKSVLNALTQVTAPIDATRTTKDIRLLFLLIASDPLFESIDDTQFRLFADTVAAKSPLSDLAEVRIRILNACTPPRFRLFSTQFVQFIFQDVLPEDVAKNALRNFLMTQPGVFAYIDKCRFLARLLGMAGQESLHRFLLNDFNSFLSSSSEREKLLLALAETCPYDFYIFYFKKERAILTGLDRRFSPSLKQVYKLCYNRLSVMQKILSGFPSLL
ncbi:MAG: hypothetical protein WCJ29_05785 [bacterium]